MASDPIQENLLKIIAEKKTALKPANKTGAKSEKAPASNVVNIMDALRKSVEADLKGRKKAG
jgi:DNA end-binding protein Ku